MEYPQNQRPLGESVSNNPLPAETFTNDFHKPCIRVGTISYIAALVLSFIPAFVLWIVYGIVPTLTQLISVATVIVSASIAWWIVEPISYFPVLGTAGSYMAFLVGGLNVRVPCAISAQTVTNAETGTQRGEIMATMGIAGSVVTTLVFVTLGAVGGSLLLKNLPESAAGAFRYVPAAIYATLLASFIVKRPDLVVFGVLFAVLLLKLGVLVLPYYLLLIFNVIVCAAFGMLLYKRFNRC